MRSQFDASKALELILYAASRLQHPGLHSVSKVLYFADKDHLARYGRFMAGDRYVAMKHGPVPSGAYDIIKCVRDGPTRFFNLPGAADAFSVQNDRDIVALRDADQDALSDSERACLDDAIERYGRLPFGRLTEVSHDDAWESADENDTIAVEAIARTVSDSTELLDYLRDRYPED